MLEGYFLDLAWLLGALFFGVMLGSLTGLIPGFHVNNVALILLALSPALLDLGIPLASVAAIIVATGTVHTFLNYIPSALIGAPDGDTALSLLPGHRMLLSGNAARGVAWSARGSQLGLFLSLPLIILARIAFGPELGWYDNLRSVLPFVLLTISFLLLATETTRLDWPAWMQGLTAADLGATLGSQGSLQPRRFPPCRPLRVGRVYAARSFPRGHARCQPALAEFGGTVRHCKPSGHLRNNLASSAPTRKLGTPSRSSTGGAVFLVERCRSVDGRTSRHDGLTSHGVGDGGRNLAAKAQGKQGYGMDWETRRLTELSDDELLEIAKAEADEGVEGPQTKQDLEVIALLSATNTAVTVMVLGFLYIISRLGPVPRWR